MVAPAEIREAGNRTNRPEGRRTSLKDKAISAAVVTVTALGTLAVLNTVFNGLEFGHWDPLYTQPVISK